MSEFLGSRISLISRSDIRYVGTLHEINSDESTVSLENVRSYGTEGRRGGGDDEAAPSDQIYEYIVFRGKDVKDLRVEEGPSTVKENKPPAVPDDPAIVGARARPNNIPPGPPNPQGVPGGAGGPGGPGGPGFGGYYPPPPMGGWGRGGGPPPMQGFYPPPPAGWFPPGQGFPPGPPGAGPWANYPQPFPPGPGGPGGPSNAPAPNNRQAPPQESRPAPIGAAGDKKPSTPAQQNNGSQQPRQPAQPMQQQQAPAARAPPPPVESKPTVEEVKATAASLAANAASVSASDPSRPIPTGPKGSARPTQIMPAVPLPAALTQKVAQPAQATASNSAPATAEALRDATQAAKAAVAVAMAKLENPGNSQQANSAAVDNLTRKVLEMRVNAPRGDAPRGGQQTRGGGGRGRGGARPAKVEVPATDFDFASSNAKFNKEDVVKEAIATGSPLGESVPNGDEEAPEAVLETTPGSGAPPAYNKTRSFFDNISSEAKDRADSGGQKPGGREWRGEEQRKNMETFGQGSVDGGYRGGYRGRGRGRGGRGRGYARGGAPRGGTPFRSNRDTQSAS